MEALGARRADGPKRRAATYANTQLGLYALCAISNRSRTSLAVTVAALNRFDANLSLLRLEKTLDGAWIAGNATSSHYRWRLGQTFSAQSTCYLEALAPDALESESVPLSVGSGEQWRWTQLRKTRLVESERCGMNVDHRPHRDALAALFAVLDPSCCR